jgi:hypothetical protein
VYATINQNNAATVYFYQVEEAFKPYVAPILKEIAIKLLESKARDIYYSLKKA